jgi:hypothetical protein
MIYKYDDGRIDDPAVDIDEQVDSENIYFEIDPSDDIDGKAEKITGTLVLDDELSQMEEVETPVDEEDDF